MVNISHTPPTPITIIPPPWRRLPTLLLLVSPPAPPPVFVPMPPTLLLHDKGFHPAGVYPPRESSLFVGGKHSIALSDGQVPQHLTMSHRRHCTAAVKSCCWEDGSAVVVAVVPPRHWTAHSPTISMSFPPTNDADDPPPSNPVKHWSSVLD